MELHDAVWRNDLPRLERLLEDIQDCNTPDCESNWTPLHLALYYGHLRSALKLLKTGARLDVFDRKNRTPLDLLSKDYPSGEGYRTDVFSWGNGMNYQLGTGNTGCVSTPHRLEKLRGVDVHTLAVSKFHGLAVGSKGDVYSWGWGMGGRLGHPESKLCHQGEAQLFPRRIEGLKDSVVIAVAAAKHHSLAVTSTGDIYAWGCNPDGRLGFPSNGNRRYTPRKLPTLKGIKGIAVAAGNAHSAMVTDSGAVYTWGSNTRGQLGYGTIDSCCNASPRSVDGLKHRKVVQISLAKHHTMALTEEGEVYSWGHKCVAPKRIDITRGTSRIRSSAVMIAAGVDRSCCLTDTGTVISWKSDDPATIEEAGGKLRGKKVISIAAGVHTLAAVVSDGNVYVWDGNHEPDVVLGMQNAVRVAVGEQHTLALQRWNAPHPTSTEQSSTPSETVSPSVASILPDFELQTSEFAVLLPNVMQHASIDAIDYPAGIDGHKEIATVEGSVGQPPSLQRMCEEAVVDHVLEPRTVVALLRFADTAGIDFLKQCCLQFIVQNLSLVLHESHRYLGMLIDDLLLDIERRYQRQILGLEIDEKLSDGAISRRPTYRFRSGSGSGSVTVARTRVTSMENRFLRGQESVQKLKKYVETKLKQIRLLEKKEENGIRLDDAQLAKKGRRGNYEKALASIHAGGSYDDIRSILEAITIDQSTKEATNTAKKNSEAGKKLPMSGVSSGVTHKQPPIVSTERATKNSEAIKKLPESISVVLSKSRDIGPMPRFLEPSRQKKRIKDRSSFHRQSTDRSPSLDPTPQESLSGDPMHLKKWTSIELESASQKSFGFKAVPSRELKKMSLSDFMVAPETPALSPEAPALPFKKQVPAWGGLQPFSDVRSFRSIQEEQRRHRPGMSTPGIHVAAMQRRTIGRWQMHSDVQIQSIQSIQIEETAVRQLSAKFKDAIVRIRPGTARETKTG